jgi:membrane-bound metal-dependent hydrolase YbcI (DUF457 family)
LTGATIVALSFPPASRFRKPIALITGAVLAVAADFDYALSWALNSPEIHRGFSHSLAFSALTGALILILTKRGEERLALAFGFAYSSHAMLDFVFSTTGGVKLLWLFSDQYYNFGQIDFFEFPLGRSFGEVLKWVLAEIAFFAPPLLLALWFKKSDRRSKLPSLPAPFRSKKR